MNIKDCIGFLGEKEVDYLIDLIQHLEESSFDYIKIENKDFKIEIGKGDLSSSPGIEVTDRVTGEDGGIISVVNSEILDSTDKQPTPLMEKTETEIVEIQKGKTVDITAPIAGIFYAQSEPGAAPYVNIGDLVQNDTVVGLIEIMKNYTTITAGVNGRITEICVEDAQFVEYGQPLFRVMPETSGHPLKEE